MKSPKQILLDVDPESTGDYFHRDQIIKMMKKYAKQWVLKASRDLNKTLRWEACTQSMLDRIDQE